MPGENPTIVMMIERQKQSISISLANTELKQVPKFNYLGKTFTENERMDREIVRLEYLHNVVVVN
jgi:hypothetical protein